jgi:putative tRNA adenosine deaminase-associated protein
MGRNLPPQWHHVAVSYFTAVLARQSRGWRVLDLDLDDAEDLDELADLVRNALPGGGPGLAIIEREDSWFALVRVDDDGDPRPFVSDLRESLKSRYAVVLESAADVDIPSDLDGLADVAVDDDAGGDDDEIDSAATSSGGVDADEADDPLIDGDEPDDVMAGAREALAPDLSDLDVDGGRPSRTWAGDPALLEDLGISAAELVQLTVEESDDPAAVLSGIGEACGFDEQLDALR